MATCRDVEADILERLHRQQKHAAAVEAEEALKQLPVIEGSDMLVPSDEGKEARTRAEEHSAPVTTSGSPGAATVAIETTSVAAAASASPGPLSPLSPQPSTRSSVWSMAISVLDLPRDLQLFYQAQRVIVMDAIRTDFKKNSLTTVSAISNWVSSALADTSVSRRLSSADPWDQEETPDSVGSGDAAVGAMAAESCGAAGGASETSGWVSSMAKHHLRHCTHFGSDQRRQVVRLVRLLSAYAVHDPETGYCQGMSGECLSGGEDSKPIILGRLSDIILI